MALNRAGARTMNNATAIAVAFSFVRAALPAKAGAGFHA